MQFSPRPDESAKQINQSLRRTDLTVVAEQDLNRICSRT